MLRYVRINVKPQGGGEVSPANSHTRFPLGRDLEHTQCANYMTFIGKVTQGLKFDIN